MQKRALPATARPSPELAPGAHYARIVATATAVPDTIVTNDDIASAYGHTVSPSVMARITGVSQRRVAPSGVVDTDLLCEAVNRCLDAANVRPDDLSKILVTKFLGDRALPMTASLLQKKLRCRTAVQGYDIDGGIHSFVQALECARNLMAAGDGPTVIASGGVINRIVSRKDPRVAFQYGDGAAAILLATADRPHVLATYAFCCPQFADLSIGFAIRTTLPENVHETRQYDGVFDLYAQRDWKPAYRLVLDAMRTTRDALLDAAGRRGSDVDLVLVTETHHRLWLAIVEHLGVETQRTVSLLSKFGNTMSAMLPMQLDASIRSGLVGPGSLVMLLSVGEGLTGGGALIEL